MALGRVCGHGSHWRAAMGKRKHILRASYCCRLFRRVNNGKIRHNESTLHSNHWLSEHKTVNLSLLWQTFIGMNESILRSIWFLALCFLALLSYARDLFCLRIFPRTGKRERDGTPLRWAEEDKNK